MLLKAFVYRGIPRQPQQVENLLNSQTAWICIQTAVHMMIHPLIQRSDSLLCCVLTFLLLITIKYLKTGESDYDNGLIT